MEAIKQKKKEKSIRRRKQAITSHQEKFRTTAFNIYTIIKKNLTALTLCLNSNMTMNLFPEHKIIYQNQDLQSSNCLKNYQH